VLNVVSEGSEEDVESLLLIGAGPTWPLPPPDAENPAIRRVSLSNQGRFESRPDPLIAVSQYKSTRAQQVGKFSPLILIQQLEDPANSTQQLAIEYLGRLSPGRKCRIDTITIE